MALQFFSDMITAKLELDRLSGNSVLKKMPRSQSVTFLETMRELQIMPDEISYNTAIHGSEWDLALHLLRELISADLRINVVAVSSAINSCQVASEWPSALVLFQQLADHRIEPDKIAISGLFSACDKGGQWPVILDTLSALQSDSMDAQLLVIAMNALTKKQRWQDAIEIFHQAELRELRHVDLHCYTALVHACGQGKKWQSACALLDQVPCPDAALFHLAMSACWWEHALRLFQRMEEAQCQPTLVTFKSLMGTTNAWHLSAWACEEMLSRSLDTDSEFQKTIARATSPRISPLAEAMLAEPEVVDCERVIKNYKESGDWESALGVVATLCSQRFTPSLVIFNSLIHSCEKAGCWDYALATLARMEELAVEANRVTLNSAISACEKGRRWTMALQLFRRLGSDADVVSYNAALSALEKSGHWQHTLLLLEQMLQESAGNSEVSPDDAKEEKWQAALALFEKMQCSEVAADEITYNCLASACESEQWQSSLFLLLQGSDALHLALAGEVPELTSMECSQAAMVLWRLAKLRRLGVSSQVVGSAARSVAASVDVKEFHLQELISSLWSLRALGAGATAPSLRSLRRDPRLRGLRGLGLRHLAMLGKVLAESQENLAHELHLVLCEMLRRVESFPIRSLSDAALKELATAALSLMYACHFSELGEAWAIRDLRQALGRLGSHFDALRRAPTVPALLPLEVPPEGGHRNLALPRVVTQGADVLVLWKPPHWQVDERDAKVTEDVTHDDRGLMSRFLQAMAPRTSLAFNEAHQRGFLHRLDVPSSGLILTAQSFEAFYDLKFQLSTGRLERDYLVLCHGRMPARSSIESRITWTSQGPEANEVSWISAAGRASKTLILRRVSETLGFTLLEIRIRTGRRHQIRVHLCYVGHPTVMDGKYTSLATQHADSKWCLGAWYRTTGCKQATKTLGNT
ncbi:unnamed protein product [Cladocopium goreaui]|nr:unnamed protein product [Cladocopium goreaui]